MNFVPGSTRLTADGQVGSGTRACRVYSIHLVSGGTGSATVLKNGTSTSGTAYVQVDGVASTGVTLNFAGGVLFPAGCYMDTDANISYAVITFNEEE